MLLRVWVTLGPGPVGPSGTSIPVGLLLIVMQNLELPLLVKALPLPFPRDVETRRDAAPALLLIVGGVGRR